MRCYNKLDTEADMRTQLAYIKLIIQKIYKIVKKKKIAILFTKFFAKVYVIFRLICKVLISIILNEVMSIYLKFMF